MYNYLYIIEYWFILLWFLYCEIVVSILRSYSTTLLIVPSYSIGFIIGLFYVVQLVSGLLLGCNYVATIDHSFTLINTLIISDIEFGSILSILHSNGAAFMICCLYLHIINVYLHNNLSISSMYSIGWILFLLVALTCFSGYCLVTGQLSLWAIVVICNLVTAIPIIGNSILVLIWGGTNVSDVTISRIFVLHYLVALLVLCLMLVHVYVLHQFNSTGNYYMVINKSDSLNMSNIIWISDLFIGSIFITFYILCLLYDLGDAEYYQSNQILVTPFEINPDFYFLMFYAIISSIPSNLVGIIMMILCILCITNVDILAGNTIITINGILFNYMSILFVLELIICSNVCLMLHDCDTIYWVLIGSILGILSANICDNPISILSTTTT